MALRIYQSANPSTAFSVEGEMTNPVRHSFDGRTGGVIEERYYLRNDDPDVSYSGIQIVVTDTEAENLVDGTDGYSWKLSAGDEQPLSQEWDTIDAGNTITMSGLGTSSESDTNTYLPFWVRVEVPANAPVDSYDDIVFDVTFTEILVP